ncbi:MAG: polysaccharide deacetylase family protein, partial [Oricola sp.]
MSRTRDLVGYGGKPPNPQWPEGKRLALQIVLNYEEGAERSIEFGDERSETLNSDNVSAPGLIGQRDFVTESHYDYGARAGYWRLMDIFDSRGLPITVFAVAQAVAKNPAVQQHLAKSRHEVCCHGLRWIDYRDVPEDVERAHMEEAFAYLTEATGKPVVGWYAGRLSAQTRSLAIAHGGFLYDSDAYDDDLPYWVFENNIPWLVVPYSFDCNDMRFASSPGFNTPEDFYNHLKGT